MQRPSSGQSHHEAKTHARDSWYRVAKRKKKEASKYRKATAEPCLVSQDLSQHRHEWIHQFQDFGHVWFDRLAGCAAELILFLDAATAFDCDRVVLVVFLVFVFGVGGCVRDGQVFEVGLEENS